MRPPLRTVFLTTSTTPSGFSHRRLTGRAVPALLTALLMVVLSFAAATEANAQTPPLSLTKSFSPSTIGPGSVSTLQFNITNVTSGALTGVAFTDNLPAGVAIADPANASATCAGTLSAPNGGTTIDFSNGSVGASTTCIITVNVTSSTVGTHSNTTSVLTWNGENTSPAASADLTVDAGRPGFTKSFSPNPILLGSKSRLTLTIDNTANNEGAISLTFTDNLPTGMTVASPANASSTCTGGTITAPAGGSVISYSNIPASSVGAGASCTVSVDVVGNAIGSLGNVTGELTSQPGPFGGTLRSSGKASASLGVTANALALTKSFTDDPVAPGDQVTLEFTIRNLSREDNATDISFTDDLDAALSGLEAVGLPASNVCGDGSSLSGTSVLTLAGGNLDPGPQGSGAPPANSTCTFSVTLQVPGTASAGSYPNTTSDITATIGGAPATGDPATDNLFVEPAPRLTKTFLDDPVGAGGTTELEFTITNTSPTSSVTDITFEDVFDVIFPTAPATPADGFCGATSTAIFTPPTQLNPATLVISGASLDPGASCTFSITLDVLAGAPTGTYTNTTSTISGTVNGSTFIGNPASDTIDVAAAPTLFKEFTDDPAQPGGTVTLEFTLTNPNASIADNIAFTDDLDAALSGLVATGLPATDVCGLGSEIDGTSTLVFTGGILDPAGDPGASCTFSVTLSVPAATPSGTYSNTTSAVAATVDGLSVTGTQATDDLIIGGLILTKEFTDDPALPGGTVTLEFTIENLSPTEDATAIAFNDDLDDNLAGLAATGLPLNDICGTGSSLTGAAGNTLLFRDGILTAGTSCTFSVTLNVPAGTPPDTYPNTTEAFSATMGGSTVVFANATDVLTVNPVPLTLTKEFTDDPVGPGDPVTLSFTIDYAEGVSTATAIGFTDDLNAVLPLVPGLSVSGPLPSEPCGVGSQLTNTSGVLELTGGTLNPTETCTFDVTLSVPGTAIAGDYPNTTSSLAAMIDGNAETFAAATDDLQILDEGGTSGRPQDAIVLAVVFATNSARINKNAVIHSGNLLVNDASPGPVLAGTFELSIDQASVGTIGETYEMKADDINIEQGSDIFYDVFYNTLTNSGTIHGALTTPLDLPLIDPSDLPAFNQAVACGQGFEDVTVPNNGSASLDAGNYNVVVVGRNATFTFTGGTYNICSLTANRDATLLFDGVSDVRIESRFASGANGVIEPTGAPFDGRDIVFYVAGIDGTGGTLGETPRAVDLGTNTTLRANIYAPNGSIFVGRASNVTGALFGKDVDVGRESELTLENFLDDSEGGTDQPDEAVAVEEEVEIPTAYALEGNYPNPFNPATRIRFALPEASDVRLVVYDMLGRQVHVLVDGRRPAGTHEVVFEAGSLPSGTYLYRLETPEGSFVQTMLLLK